MVRSILKAQSPSSQSHSPQPSVSFSKTRHPRLSSTPPPLILTSSLPSPHVHFPPTPTIVSSTYITHSSSIYDRAPIQVSPNSCELPERGGRVLHTGTPPIMMKVQHAHREDYKGSYFHPFAYEACEPEYADVPSLTSVPQLIRDSCSSSSESDESTDGYGSPHLSPIPMLNPISPTAMSFLPHAGYPPKKKSDGGRPKLKRRKTPVGDVAYGGSWRSRRTSMEEPPSLDGCLGGF